MNFKYTSFDVQTNWANTQYKKPSLSLLKTDFISLNLSDILSENDLSNACLSSLIFISSLLNLLLLYLSRYLINEIIIIFQ